MAALLKILRASVRATSARLAVSPICCGHIDRRIDQYVR
jgi:hypothetical protein